MHTGLGSVYFLPAQPAIANPFNPCRRATPVPAGRLRAIRHLTSTAAGVGWLRPTANPTRHLY